MGGSGLIYLAAAYSVIWILLFVYLISIHQRLANVRDQLRAAEKRIEADTESHSVGVRQ